MNIAFIGLGRMGRGMAQRLLGGGHDLAVYDAISAQAEPLAAAGARAAASVADVCAGRDVVVTMLVEDAAVLDIASRPGGLCESLPKGAIHLAMGTYGVGAIRALAEAHAAAGQVLVAAPVLGRPDLAASGQLGVVSGGPDEAVRICAPLLDLMGRRTFHAGPLPESATAIKLANNMLLGCAMVAMAEGLSLVRESDSYGPRVLGAPVNRVKGRVRAMKGTFSGGTAASIKATFAAAAKDLSLVALLKNPFVLTPGFEGPKQPPGNKPLFDQELNAWTAPFVMATINTRNVHRSNLLMGFPYGKDFVYDEMVLTGPGEKGEANAKFVVAANAQMGGAGGPKPGEGPSKQERENGMYDLLFVALAPDGRQVRVAVRGDRDPGYGSTSKMIAECAICLLRDTPEIPGGIWTPGAAMGHRLITRLVDHAGLTFAVET
jgi:3-hydroxyisobutyrate dehydrogenase-like beta-hydroxyacid dehydrogenase